MKKCIRNLTTIIALTLIPLSQNTFASEGRDFRQCVYDLCGSEQDYLPLKAEGSFGEATPEGVKKFLSQDVEPRLQKIMGSAKRAVLFKMKVVDSLEPVLKQSPLASKQLAVLMVFGMIRKISHHIDASATNDAMGRFTISYEKLQPLVPEIQPVVLKPVVDLMNIYLSSSAGTYSSLMNKISYDMFKMNTLSVVPEDRKIEVWRRKMSDFKTQAWRLQQELGSFIFNELNPDLLDKAGSGETLTFAEKKDLVKLMSVIYSTQGVSDMAPEKLAALNFDASEALKALGWQTQRAGLLSVLQKPTEYNALKTTIIASCQSAIIQAVAAGPSPFRKRKALELLAKIKIAAKEAAASYLQGADLQKAIEALDRVELVTPDSEADVRKNILAVLDLTLRNSESFLKAMESARTELAFKSLFVSSASTLLPAKENVLVGGLQNLCNGLKPPGMEDMVVDGRFLRMGWQTTIFPEIGAGVVAHELGHVVSQSIRLSTSARYHEARMCSTEQHAALMTPAEKFSLVPSQFEEEDWADYFSATTIKILNKTWPYTKNFACAALRMDDEKKFTDLKLHLPERGRDNHSAELYRVLHIHIDLGRSLPPSCVTALGAKLPTISRACAQ